MAGNQFDTLTAEQKLRMTVHKDVRKICQEATHLMGMEIHTHAMELIAEMTWKKILIFAADLELFSKHAKRSTINSEDVKLLVRRNPSLKEHITKLSESHSSNTKESKKKRSTGGASTVPQPSKSNTSKNTSKGVEPVASTSKNHTALMLDNDCDSEKMEEMLFEDADMTIDLT